MDKANQYSSDSFAVRRAISENTTIGQFHSLRSAFHGLGREIKKQFIKDKEFITKSFGL